MMKQVLAGIMIAGMVLLSGCGQVAQNVADNPMVGPNNQQTALGQVREVVVASSKVTLQLGQQTSGFKPESIGTLGLTTTTSVESDVPSLVTFAVSSNVVFNISALKKVEADGSIQIQVVYNDLLASNLQGLKVVARMQDSSGLVGQQDSSRIIPLEIKPVGGVYQRLTTANLTEKYWARPFPGVINETISLKLQGDFANAFRQKYTGTITLELVREEGVAGSGKASLLKLNTSSTYLVTTANRLNDGYFTWTNPEDVLYTNVSVSADRQMSVKLLVQIYSSSNRLVKEKMVSDNVNLNSGINEVLKWNLPPSIDARHRTFYLWNNATNKILFGGATPNEALIYGQFYTVKISLLDSAFSVLSAESLLAYADPSFINGLTKQTMTSNKSVTLVVKASSIDDVFNNKEVQVRIAELASSGSTFINTYDSQKDLSKRLSSI